MDESGGPSTNCSVAIEVVYRKPSTILLRGESSRPAEAVTALTAVASQFADALRDALRDELQPKLVQARFRLEALDKEWQAAWFQLRAVIDGWLARMRGQVESFRAEIIRKRQDQELSLRYAAQIRRALEELWRAKEEDGLREEAGRLIVTSPLTSDMVMRENQLYQYEYDSTRRIPAAIEELEGKQRELREQIGVLDRLRTLLDGHPSPATTQGFRDAVYQKMAPGYVDLTALDPVLRRLQAEFPEQLRVARQQADDFARRVTAPATPSLLGTPEVAALARTRPSLSPVAGAAVGLFASIVCAFGVEVLRRAGRRPGGELGMADRPPSPRD